MNSLIKLFLFPAENPISILVELEKKINNLVEENQCLQNLGIHLLNEYLHLQPLENENKSLKDKIEFLESSQYDSLKHENAKLKDKIKRLESENLKNAKEIDNLINKNMQYEIHAEEVKNTLTLWKKKEESWKKRELELKNDHAKIKSKLHTYRERDNRLNLKESNQKRKRDFAPSDN